MSADPLPIKAEFHIYTAYNTKKDKVSLVFVSGGQQKTHVVDNCGGKCLMRLLEEIDAKVIDGMTKLNNRQNVSEITLVFKRYNNKNLSDCMNRISRTLGRLKLVGDELEDRLIHGALLARNGSKLASYDVLKRIIEKLRAIEKSGCEVKIEQEKARDDYSMIAWQLIK